MIIPGIQTISYCPAANVPADIEMKSLCGESIDISQIDFTPIEFIGEPSLQVEDHNENNGDNKSAKLSFVSESRLSGKRLSFVVSTVNGATIIIGTAASVPSLKSSTAIAGAATQNACRYEVELSSPCAWIELNALLKSGATGLPVGYDPWREITEEEIDDIIDALPDHL